MNKVYIKAFFLSLLAAIFIIGGVYYFLTNDADLESSFVYPLQNTPDLSVIIDQIGTQQYILLGEASHGTSEFYSLRAKLSKKLITEKNVSFIAVEGDWFSLYELNKFVKDMPGAKKSARDILQDFARWPQWMWANQEVEDFIIWLREYNQQLAVTDRVGFYGMDVYGMWPALEESYYVMRAIEEEAQIAGQHMYDCLAPFKEEFMHSYVEALARDQGSCAGAINNVADLLQANEKRYKEDLGAQEYFKLFQNFSVVKGAEEHARYALQDQIQSWNARVKHMKKTVENLMDFYGTDSKAVVWAHNTHVGDARATNMAVMGQKNMGQLLREKYGKDANYIVGMGTNRGTVIAGRAWGEPYEIMEVPEAIFESYENMITQKGQDVILLLTHPDVRKIYFNQVGHRAIGVVYNPEREHLGNYVPTKLADRYDAFIFVEETRSLTPIHQN